jgi:hypothetical protein
MFTHRRRFRVASDAYCVQESVPINTQLEQLGQKYMGLRPRQSHASAVFNGMHADVKGNHPVPISNFMNAQCMCPLSWSRARGGDGF